MGGSIYNDRDILRIADTAEVTIRRIRFKDGWGYFEGGAVSNKGTLRLESCIFSGNRAGLGSSNSGGAVHNQGGRLSILGCTFYDNHTQSYSGGAIRGEGGTIAITGNLFYGNTAGSRNVVSYTANSGGYNISDYASGLDGSTGSGWVFEATDTQVTVFPITPVSFKPIAGSAVLGHITARPADYPEYDFYGAAIPVTGAAAGAVQTPAAGYYLSYGEAGNGTVSLTSGTLDVDGVTNGSVSLEATASGNSVFDHWVVNGAAQPAQTPPHQITLFMTESKTVTAVFYRYITVSSAADSGAGSLRAALLSAEDNDIITLTGQTITLGSTLNISKSLIIEGNGATLSGNNAVQILSINGDVTIRRVHFKDGRTNYGGAIGNYGSMRVESCIFSGNQGVYAEDAIANQGSLAILGSTFYYNGTSGSYTIGANSAGTSIELTGNLFYENVLRSGYSIVSAQVVTSRGYNAADKPSGYFYEIGKSGWIFTAGDQQVSALPISPVSFRPLAGSAVLNTMATRPADYPLYDFYGTAIPASGAASGAVQTAAGSGYYLDYGAVNGTVSISNGSPTPDGDGLYSSSSSVTLEATANPGYTFSHWTVDGVIQQGLQSPENEFIVIMNAHKTVRAICSRTVTVNTLDNSGSGSLREALDNAADLDTIIIDSSLTGGTIALTSRLPEINKSITIEGNGVILSGSGITPTSDSSQIMYIRGGEVTIRRVHFKDGMATNFGGAIYKTGGTLNLESCIFSGNRTTDTYAYGGAINNNGALIVSGCTFSENTAGERGGVIFNYGDTITLTGNLFYGNTAAINRGNVVNTSSGGTVNSSGYNISDNPSGPNYSGGSDWTFVNGDIQVTDTTFDAAFTPSSATNLKIITPSLPAGFPATYFDGTSRGIPATPGAMPQQ
jgi:hypothetical protein